MKIGFVFDDSLDNADGVQQYITTLAAQYVALGHEVHYLTGETIATEVAGGTVHSLSKNLKVRFNGNRLSIPRPTKTAQIRAVVRELQLDVLHVQMPFSPFMAAKVIHSADARTAVVATFHIAPYSRLVAIANYGLALLVRRAVKRCDKIVSVSPAAAAFAKQGYGITTDVLPNVVNVDRFMAAAQPNPPKRIVFLGRLVPRKGCQILLQAVAQLHKAGQMDGWTVDVGSRGPLEAQLKQYVQAEGLQDTVTFSGFIAEADKPAFFANASLAVFPSSGGESFGIVLIEAMASQNPVVLAGDNSGYRSVMGKRPDQLFAPQDGAELAAKMEVLMSDPLAADDARDWQRTEVGQYNVTLVADKLLAIYDRALQSRRA
jgi:phosphatidylinositol alpha-mannosyltransferase